MSAERARAWGYLALTVALEVFATLMLKASQGLSVLMPSVLALAGYAATIVALALALKVLPMSVAYMIWTGAGTSGVALLGAWIFGDHLSALSWVGLALVVIGVVLINGSERPKEGHA